MLQILHFFTNLGLGGTRNFGGPGCSPVSTPLYPPLVQCIYGYCSSRTSRLWWIAHSTQPWRRSCNISPNFAPSSTNL